MDALISNSSKSYYACVGESTHAYQSPSKDLTAINNRLNGHGYDFVYVAITFYFGFVVHEKKKKINNFLIRILFLQCSKAQRQS